MYEIVGIATTLGDEERRAAPLRRLAAVAGVVGLGAVAVAILATGRAGWPEWPSILAEALTGVSWLLPGWLIAARRPRLPFGWLLLAGGLFLAVGSALTAYGSPGVARGWPAAVWAAWVGGWIFSPYLGCHEAIYLLFPTGALPSPRWRRVLFAVVVVNAAMVLAGGFSGGPIGPTGALADIASPGPHFAPLGALFPVVVLGQNVLDLMGMWVIWRRWRRAAGADRRVLAVVFGFGVLDAVVGVALVAPEGDWVFALAVLSSTGLTIAIAWGLLRHGLWNVRVIVSRTLTWLVLTGLLLGGISACIAVVDLAVTGSSGRTVGLVVAAAITTVLLVPIERRLRQAIDHLLFGDRVEPYTVLSTIGAELEATGSPAAALDRLVAGIRSSLKVAYAAVELVDRNAEAAVVAASGAATDEVLRMPVAHHGDSMGWLVVGQHPGDRPFRPGDRRLLQDLARQVGAAAAAVALTTALQTSRQRIVSGREEERRRLRRELHDGVASALTAIGLKVDSAAAVVSSDSARARGILETVQSDVTVTLGEVRRVVTDLRPPSLDDLGLVGALAQLASRFDSPSLHLGFAASGVEDRDLTAAVELAVYRIATEALQNVARHAEASACEMRLCLADEQVVLTVEDDGVGIGAPNGDHPGLGLRGMLDRADELGGTLAVGKRIDGRPGAMVSASFPVGGGR